MDNSRFNGRNGNRKNDYDFVVLLKMVLTSKVTRKVILILLNIIAIIPYVSIFNSEIFEELSMSSALLEFNIKNTMVFILSIIWIASLIPGAVILSLTLKNILLSGKKSSGKSSLFTIYILIVSITLFITSSCLVFFNKLTNTYLTPGDSFFDSIIFIAVLTVLCELLSEEPKKKSNLRKKTKRTDNKAFTYKIISFLFIAAFLTLVYLSLTTDVVVSTLKLPYSEYELRLNASDLFSNIQDLPKDLQVLAFLVFCGLVSIVVSLTLTVASAAGKNKWFAKFSTATVFACGELITVTSLFGKYYEIVQKMNQQSLKEIFDMFTRVDGSIIDPGLIETIDVYFTTTSPAFIIFPIALALASAMVFTRPISRYEKEMLKAIQKEEKGLYGTNESGELIEEELPANIPDKKINNLNGSYGIGICPIFEEIDKQRDIFERNLEIRENSRPEKEMTLSSLVNYIVDYARECRLRLTYSREEIATFIAGMASSKLAILQGMSGTGKTSLPKIITEVIMGRCDIIEVESAWRDKNELLGYYNEFSKIYTPKKFTQALYRAALNPDIPTFIVLDEMNLSRIEYYFSDFLSLMENENEGRVIRLANVRLVKTDSGTDSNENFRGLTAGHTIKIPKNVWFVGTANRDESTFEISDKVYDRASTMNFDRRAPKARPILPSALPQIFVSYSDIEALFEKALSEYVFDIESSDVIRNVEEILAPYNISFGNRIANQIEKFVSVYSACFPDKPNSAAEGLEKVLIGKVIRKLETKSITDKEAIAEKFDRLKLHECANFVRHLNEEILFD